MASVLGHNVTMQAHNLVLWEDEGTLSVLKQEQVTRLGGIGDICTVKNGKWTFTAKLVSEGKLTSTRVYFHSPESRSACINNDCHIPYLWHTFIMRHNGWA